MLLAVVYLLSLFASSAAAYAFDAGVLEDTEGTSLLQKGAEPLGSSARQQAAALLALDDAGPDMGLGLAPVRPSVWAVQAVLVMYFLVYAMLAIVYAYNQAQGTSGSPLEKSLESAVMGVCFAPMLCSLFLSVYKRADTLAHGEPGKYDLPPFYVRFAMGACVIAFGVQMVLYICREFTINKYVGKGHSMSAAAFWNTLANIAMLAMYVAAGFIIFGLISMSQPREEVQQQGPLEISSGIFCCNVLVVLYFAVYAALQIAKTLDIWHMGRGNHAEALSDPFRYVIEVLKIAASSMQLAPMLAVVFVAVQLAVDADKKAMPRVVETAMYLCCFTVCVQVAVAIITPFATRAKLEATQGGIPDFSTDHDRLFNLMSIIRGVCMAALYGALCILCSYLWGQKEAPVWTILVTHLATYFFVVYLFLWLVVTFRQIADGGLTSGMRTLTTAKNAVNLAPMLSILFMESWVKASGIQSTSGRTGVPQGSAQDYMFVATWSMLFQLILCFFNGFVFTLPKDSKVMRSCGACVRAGLTIISLLFYLAMVTIYACTVMVLASLFTNTSQSATGAGAWFS